MALPDYVTHEELKAYATQYQKADEIRHEAVIPRASRMIDQMCGVPTGYFGIAINALTERRVQGSGISLLRVPPYCAGTIEYLEYSEFYDYAPDYQEIKDDNGAQWLRAQSGVWDRCQQVSITAVWGFEEVPTEITQATLELALIIWRQRDPALTKIQTDVNGAVVVEAAIPTRVKAICKEWMRRRAVVIA